MIPSHELSFNKQNLCIDIFRFGIIARSTTSMAPPSGTLPITCRSSLSDFTTLGSWSSENAILDGPTRGHDPGSTHAVNAMESVAPLTTRWFFVTIVMPCTDLLV